MKYSGFSLKRSRVRLLELSCGHGNICNGKGRASVKA